MTTALYQNAEETTKLCPQRLHPQYCLWSSMVAFQCLTQPSLSEQQWLKSRAGDQTTKERWKFLPSLPSYNKNFAGMPSDWNNARQDGSFIDTVKAAFLHFIKHSPAFQGWNSIIIWTLLETRQLPWDPNQEKSILAAGVIRINWFSSWGCTLLWLPQWAAATTRDRSASLLKGQAQGLKRLLLLLSQKLRMYLSSQNISQF